MFKLHSCSYDTDIIGEQLLYFPTQCLFFTERGQTWSLMGLCASPCMAKESEFSSQLTVSFWGELLFPASYFSFFLLKW